MEPSPEAMPGPSDRGETHFLVACSLAPHFEEFNLRLITSPNRSFTEI
jgi:hypothetical protein